VSSVKSEEKEFLGAEIDVLFFQEVKEPAHVDRIALVEVEVSKILLEK